MKKIIRLSSPDISRKEISSNNKVLASGWITSGPKTLEMEKIIKKKIKTKNVIAVNSCTSGIMASLIALGAKKGDEILTTANTFISSINTFYNLGLKIKLCDINLETFNIDEKIFNNNISNKTRFFVPVHNGGSPENFDKVLNSAKQKKIRVVDDAATAFGSKIGKKFIGSFNHSTSVFSLHANKNCTSGEGGFICTNNNSLALKLRMIINNGLDAATWNRKSNYLNAKFPGYKLNYNDILAAISIEQIKKIEKTLQIRKTLTDKYYKNLDELIKNNLIKTQKISKTNRSGYYNFQILLNIKGKRDKFIKFLNSKNIQTSIHYTPCYEHQFYRNKFNTKYLVNTKKIFNNVVSLPLHNRLAFSDIDFICSNILKFFKYL